MKRPRYSLHFIAVSVVGSRRVCDVKGPKSPTDATIHEVEQEAMNKATAYFITYFEKEPKGCYTANPGGNAG